MGEFKLPDLGEGLTDAEVLRWMVAVGDEVVIDQPVVEVETAKAAVEVPIPFAGIVAELLVAEGDLARVGQPLIRIETAVGEACSQSEQGERPGLREPGIEIAQSEGSGNVLIGYGTPHEGARRRRRPARPATSAATPAPTPAQDTSAESADAARSQPQQRIQVRGVISPVVRRLARDAGVDLNTLRPADGEIICRADVERAIAARHDGPATDGVATVSSTQPSPIAGIQRIALEGARGFVAAKLSRSRREIPEATVWVDVDASGLIEARRAVTSATQPISVLALLSRFVVAGLRRYPQLNARIVDGVIEQHAQINLGFAAQTDRGLVVPVVEDAGGLSLRELSVAMAERTAQARAGSLGQQQLSGGTFTVNNYGVFGVDGSAAIINHPEVAILGIGRIIERPWVVDSQIEVRKVAQLTIAFDHRACDGGVAGGFLRFVADCVENPAHALMEL